MTIQNGVVKISSATSVQIDLIVKLPTYLKASCFSFYLLKRYVVMKIKDRKDWSVIFCCALEPVMVSYFLSLHYPPWKMNKFWILRFCETHLFIYAEFYWHNSATATSHQERFYPTRTKRLEQRRSTLFVR